MSIEYFESELDYRPMDWDFRRTYANWLAENSNPMQAKLQRWFADNKKCPGPSCVIEAAWHEASWWRDRCEGQKWTFNYNDYGVIKPEWCLPEEAFERLTGFITHRRDGAHKKDGIGFHNQFVKSWLGRRYAETALLQIARGKIVTMRTLDAPWDDDEYEGLLFGHK